MDLGLTGRVALIAGSSAGLGKAVALRLAREGARVGVNGRDRARCEGTAAEIRSRTLGDARPFPADVSDADQAQRVVDATAEEFGRLDILVCNAGGPPLTAFKDAPADAWQRALELSLLSTVYLCRAAVPYMRRIHWGRIVCLTSVAAKQPLPGLILSSTARAGVLGFAKTLADEVATEGINVSVVCPGFIRTERIETLVSERAKRERKQREAILTELLADVPLGRIGEPDELASAVVFLASERAAYVTGAVLAVDGGYLRSIG